MATAAAVAFATAAVPLAIRRWRYRIIVALAAVQAVPGRVVRLAAVVQLRIATPLVGRRLAGPPPLPSRPLLLLLFELQQRGRRSGRHVAIVIATRGERRRRRWRHWLAGGRLLAWHFAADATVWNGFEVGRDGI